MIQPKLTKTKMIIITKTLVIFPLAGQVSEWRSVLRGCLRAQFWGHFSLRCI